MLARRQQRNLSVQDTHDSILLGSVYEFVTNQSGFNLFCNAKQVKNDNFFFYFTDSLTPLGEYGKTHLTPDHISAAGEGSWKSKLGYLIPISRLTLEGSEKITYLQPFQEQINKFYSMTADESGCSNTAQLIKL